MLITKKMFPQDLKRFFFKLMVVSFCIAGAIFLLPAPSNAQTENVGTVQQPFLVGGFPPHLTQRIKGQIDVDICGAGLPASQTDRQNLQNDFQNAILAWAEPMRIFGAPLTRTVNVGLCGSNIRTRTITERDCEFDIETRRVICENSTREERIPPDLNVIMETTIPPSNRSYYSPEAKTVHLVSGIGYNTVLHEIGHAFGLGDTYAEGGFFCDIHHDRFAPASTSVMCNANFANLQPDDIAGVQHLYCAQFATDCRRGVLTVENDVDRPGQDYDSFDLGAANPRICYDRCAEDNACKAYTYVPPGVQGTNARCWLKNILPPATSRAGMVSGYKP
jgi:PAN domain